MDRHILKREAGRLISEAPDIAPTITHFARDKTYGNVTDEGLDAQSAQRWHLEVSSVLIKLSESKIPAFVKLQGEHYSKQMDSESCHIRAIFIHQSVQCLETAIQLLNSPLAQDIEVDNTNDVAAPSSVLEPPQNVTIPWLLKHVPVRLWLAALGLLAGVFSLGVGASHLPLVQETFGLVEAICNNST